MINSQSKSAVTNGSEVFKKIPKTAVRCKYQPNVLWRMNVVESIVRPRGDAGCV